MAEKLFMTALSPTMERGMVTSWHKKEGDAVKSGEVLCEVETDKAVMEYEADFDAVLLKIIVKEGQGAEIGETIAIYGEEGEDVSSLAAESNADVEKEKEKEKEKESPGKPETEEKAPEEYVSEPALPAKSLELNSEPSGSRLRSSPLARRMAEDSGIDINAVHGSGTAGRVVKRDIQAMMSSSGTGKEVPSSRTAAASGMRGIIAQRLSASKFSAPHYYLTVSADMSSVLSARKAEAAQSGSKISINSYIIKFLSSALKKNPTVNASWNNGNIAEFDTVDIGFAVALPNGLITPVIRKIENKGIADIDSEFRELAGRAQNGKLSPDEYSNATFTISNLGSFGIEEFTAIINPPGSAILAMGAIIKKQVVVTNDSGNDEVVIKPMMKMTLSCDHRVIDGAVGAAFIADLKRMIENPISALM